MDLQASAQGRQEARVPLDALVELTSDGSGEVLEADGIDLGSGGLSMRASFVPPVGARLGCHFRCPPTGEHVDAQGEVVWSEWSGPRSGAFGLRFLELDTKSATAIRHMIEPEAPEAAPADQAGLSATMRIDGLGAPVEADIRVSEADHIVLEQELTFLKLGRGVEVDVPGGGKQRGRIASVELRQSPLDVPTLVFGVLLDTAEVPKPVAPSIFHAAAALPRDPTPAAPSRRGTVPAAPEVAARGHELEDGVALRAPASRVQEPEPLRHTAQPAETLDGGLAGAHDPQVEALAPSEAVDPGLAPQLREERVAAPVDTAHERLADDQAISGGLTPREAEPAAVAHARELGLEGAHERDAGVQASTSGSALAPSHGPIAVLVAHVRRWFNVLALMVRSRLLPPIREVFGKVSTAGSEAKPKLDEARSSFVGRARIMLALQQEKRAKRKKARAAAKRRTTAPAPKQQRPTAAGRSRPAAGSPSRAPSPIGRRLAAAAMVVAGVGLGVYALAPRSEADRIPVRIRRTSSEASAPTMPAATPTVAPAAQPSAAPSQATPAAAEPANAVTPAPVEGSAPAPSAAEVQPRTFGAASVPNGRVFSLRMSGPVDTVEGESRENGFTVRIPGRLALDRASPIATSHRAVARAMILNRGNYAELTVDFLPGFAPKYQVKAVASTIEIALQRP